MSRFERWSVWLTAGLTAVTGAGLFWTKYLLESADPWAVVNSPLQPVFLKMHILFAPLLVFALGMIAVRHVWQHYRARLTRGRRSGVLTALVTAPMVLSGYLIQVVTKPDWLNVVAITHIVASALFGAGFAAHQVFVRRRLQAARELERRRVPGRSSIAQRPVGVAPLDQAG